MDDKLSQRNTKLCLTILAFMLVNTVLLQGIAGKIAEEHGLQILTHGGQHIGVVSKGKFLYLYIYEALFTGNMGGMYHTDNLVYLIQLNIILIIASVEIDVDGGGGDKSDC